MSVTVERAELASAEARALIARLDAELGAIYPEEGANHFRLDPEEVAPGRGGFFLARRAGAGAVACGAVRWIGDGACEVKRMFVVPEARGQGIAKLVLVRLVEEARGLGAARLVLETGLRQLEALALYERAGFVRIPPYGEYVGSPLSVCMMKPLG